MPLISHSNLSKDFSLILNDADDYNVIIQVGENKNIKKFHAHSVILRARSSYFRIALSTRWATKKNNMITFNKPNITPTGFEMILKYIYTGELNLNKHTNEDILKLLIALDEIFLKELFKYVQYYLIENQINWVHENADFIFHTIIKLENCRLKDYCLGYIRENPRLFITPKNFLSLDKEVLFDLLKEDLQMNEIDIWKYLIKWGIEQTSGLEDNKIKWNNDNYKALKKTLNQFIPLIRYAGISHKEFFDKVIPFKAIIPKNIYEEIENFYNNNLSKTTTLAFIKNLPLRTDEIKSNIIKSKFTNVIVNWINKKDATSSHDRNDPLYKFKLIYNRSGDEIENISFKNKCKGRVASLVLIKVERSNKIFGGYSSIGFNSLGVKTRHPVVEKMGYKESSDNFIFSIEDDIFYPASFMYSKNPIVIKPNLKIGRVINRAKAMIKDRTHGFNFGCNSLSMINRTLQIKNNGIYGKILHTDEVHVIKEIETFIVTKRE
ncbi:hypothetical protein RclHR1_11120006 [Rhizophagus clarus]|uniref:BTB domain-containing protein n=1 Tax=Rhizophagus clarus TaxID=94130 RepID=A0A2Z6Q829_9GLOM|nr:hypothetical protein RclHR1_11120006 [Rhizophagus clarus]GES87601.1 hypothetical protein GLOIN_2v1470542 [Rhizophagus clarus]